MQYILLEETLSIVEHNLPNEWIMHRTYLVKESAFGAEKLDLHERVAQLGVQALDARRLRTQVELGLAAVGGVIGNLSLQLSRKPLHFIICSCQGLPAWGRFSTLYFDSHILSIGRHECLRSKFRPNNPSYWALACVLKFVQAPPTWGHLLSISGQVAGAYDNQCLIKALFFIMHEALLTVRHH